MLVYINRVKEDGIYSAVMDVTIDDKEIATGRSKRSSPSI